MSKAIKASVICPACGTRTTTFVDGVYMCAKCGWDSTTNTADILFDNLETAVLSNLYPHKFPFYTSGAFGMCHEVQCLSMESFIQSLRVKDPVVQKYICENLTGPMVHKLKPCLRDWREDGYVYWNGSIIMRDSATYQELISTAYDCLFEGNQLFREFVLPHFKGMYLIHSIGNDHVSQTLLTESEFRYQLNRLMQRLDYVQGENNE